MTLFKFTNKSFNFFYLINVSFICLMVLSFNGTVSAASPPPSINLTPKDLDDITRVEDYMNQIQTLKARFQQYSPDSGIAFGTIYIKRPGRMRVEYEPPSAVVLIADGSLVSYYDREIDELSQAPLSSTPAWFLVRDPVSLTKDVTITAIERAPGALRIALYQTKEPDAGSVELIFSDKPLELKQWAIVDPNGKETRVGLFGSSIGSELPDSLFERPEKKSGRKRN
ncbi:MAG: outer membrane lipoprotein carrier protein LolA [Alphaproteobacteria bacterium]|nr:outer membrane lipoprotein carrier protein LolA [Alphaproteobacteria bacterium]